jgi:hypothetical protein
MGSSAEDRAGITQALGGVDLACGMSGGGCRNGWLLLAMSCANAFGLGFRSYACLRLRMLFLSYSF